MGIFTYGALLNENKILTGKIKHIQCILDLVLQETNIQKTVIGQLKTLLDSKLYRRVKPCQEQVCDRGHFMCKIDHSRFSWSNNREVC